MTIFDSNFRNGKSSKSCLFASIRTEETFNYKTMIGSTTKSMSITGIKPSKLKRVKFADECGDSLLKVIYYKTSDLSDLESCVHKMSEMLAGHEHLAGEETAAQYDWVASFIQPAALYSRFREDLNRLRVKLASVMLQRRDKSTTTMMSGIVRVLNVGFEKSVFVRLSNDHSWSSGFTDHDARYRCSLSEGVNGVDEFEFELELELPCNSAQATSLEFVVCYRVGGSEYWDNRDGSNYRLDYCKVLGDLAADNYGSGVQQQQQHALSGPLNNVPLSSSSSLMSSSSTSTPFTLDFKPNFNSFNNVFTDYRAWNHFANESNFY